MTSYHKRVGCTFQEGENGHNLVKIPPTQKQPYPQKKCLNCLPVRKDSRTMCSKCGKGFCNKQCLKSYHRKHVFPTAELPEQDLDVAGPSGYIRPSERPSSTPPADSVQIESPRTSSTATESLEEPPQLSSTTPDNPIPIESTIPFPSASVPVVSIDSQRASSPERSDHLVPLESTIPIDSTRPSSTATESLEKPPQLSSTTPDNPIPIESTIPFPSAAVPVVSIDSQRASSPERSDHLVPLESTIPIESTRPSSTASESLEEPPQLTSTTPDNPVLIESTSPSPSASVPVVSIDSQRASSPERSDHPVQLETTRPDSPELSFTFSVTPQDSPNSVPSTTSELGRLDTSSLLTVYAPHDNFYPNYDSYDRRKTRRSPSSESPSRTYGGRPHTPDAPPPLTPERAAPSTSPPVLRETKQPSPTYNARTPSPNAPAPLNPEPAAPSTSPPVSGKRKRSPPVLRSSKKKPAEKNADGSYIIPDTDSDESSE